MEKSQKCAELRREMHINSRYVYRTTMDEDEYKITSIKREELNNVKCIENIFNTLLKKDT